MLKGWRSDADNKFVNRSTPKRRKESFVVGILLLENKTKSVSACKEK